MCSEPDYFWDVHRTDKRTARQHYRCVECGGAICIGRQYVYTFAHSSECGNEVFRTHVECEELRDFVQDVVCGGHGQVFMGHLEDEIEEAGQYIGQDEAAWEAAGLDVPNPLREVFEEIAAHYFYGPLLPSRAALEKKP